MILSDIDIRRLSEFGMITPYEDGQLTPGAISWGQSSYGYDIRIARRFKVFNDPLKMFGGIIDPKATDWHKCFTEIDADCAIIPPNSFLLGESVETFNVPRHILCVCVGKSTYARCGIIVNVTPLEPEWQGKITIEVSNTTPLPAKIYANEGIAQVLFFSAMEIVPIECVVGKVCERSYADKRGKYQGQTGLTMPRVNVAK